MHIGIDTSCYTTSVAAVSDGKIVFDERVMLKVPKGSRGLRQSDAVFMHTRNLADIFEKVSLENVKSVSVSSKPRNVEGSYMPVFMSGVSAGKVAAAALGCKYSEFSHQQGHIMAGLYSADCLNWRRKPYLAMHISGGTTELLLVYGDKIDIVGKTLDISAGQLIDRVGVHLGMEFPCGMYMQEAAKKRTKDISLPVSVKGLDINFSGAETQAMKMSESLENIASALLGCIGESLAKVLQNAQRKFDVENVLMVGGVAANLQIRKLLSKKVKGISFASEKLSSDNAVGIALLGSGI